jgi:hypothetical protein
MVQDIHTRWDSTYLMAIRALLLRNDLNQWVLESDNTKLQQLTISDLEWKQVEYVLAILYPFWKYTQAVSVSRGITIHRAWQVYNKLFQHLEDRQHEAEKEGEWKESLVRALEAAKEKLGIYYGRTEKEKGIIYAVAAVLDPSKRLAAYDSDTWTPRERKFYKEQILTFYKENYLEFETRPTVIPSTSSSAIEVTILSNNHRYFH